MSKKKNKYWYYAAISHHGGISKVISEPFTKFTYAWRHLNEMMLPIYLDNAIDFAGVIKVKEGEKPNSRLKDMI